MDGGARWGLAGLTRITAAVFVALFGALGIWLLISSSRATAGGAGSEALLPDLVVETPYEIVLQRTGGKKKPTYLRFSHTTANVGDGPLEIYPDLDAEDCDDRGERALVAYQAIYQDSNANGTFEDNADTGTVSEPVGCMIFHDIHNHYHFEDFAEYELYRMKSGKLKETSDKVSFCVVDILRPYPELPGSPDETRYRFKDCLTDSGIHGISIGWADIYRATTPGQEFDVSDRRRGRYCLVARADPADRLSERAGGNDNNAQSIQIRVNRKRATSSGWSVPVVDEPCSPPSA